MLVSVELMRLWSDASSRAAPWGRVTAKALPTRRANENKEAVMTNVFRCRFILQS
jgi:hypothetical protein